MPAPDPESRTADVTLLLEAVAAGDSDARDRLLDSLYVELRRLATSVFADHGARGHTLQPTAVVHEAWVKLVGSENQSYEGRRHFLRVAGRAMRQVLLNHARDRQAQKRGGGRLLLPLAEVGDVASEPAPFVDLLAIEEALSELEAKDPQQARIVELRYFAGLTIDETAEALGISATTVKVEWRMARAELVLLLGDRDG